MTLFLSVEFALILGVTAGWFASEKFQEYLAKERHAFQELFDENPHPELFKADGSIDKGEYVSLNFEPGYDPEDFDPEDIVET